MPTRYQLANAIRALSMDAVEKAQSGHPGMPMGMADIAEVLWRDFLKHNPCDPNWHNRDRFILSNGHGAMLHYALLHLSGYDITIDDLKQFRQLHSKTPGHPELGHTPGIETSTGPLGQGLANGVGMAIAEKLLALQFNRDHFNIVDHYSYVIVGDGCLMEGISHEVCSLAGVLGLNKLIVIWDNNGISIDGKVKPWFADCTTTRFESYGWQVIAPVDGHDSKAIAQALIQARQETHKPSLICCHTTIGYGAPNKANTSAAHGSPLGSQEIALARQQLHWPYPPFEIPKAIYQAWNQQEQGRKWQKHWQQCYDAYQQAYPTLARAYQRRINGQLPEKLPCLITELLQAILKTPKALATRQVNTKVLETLMPLMPELLGGSADLSSSNATLCSKTLPLTANQTNANYLHYGVREFGMTAIMNGIALHRGFIPYGGTFLVFASYNISAVRMSALMKQRVIHIFTHDSIGLGEDGPTHQPVEQLPMLRAIPNLSLWRPCDAIEAVIAWQMALENHSNPTALCQSRQPLPLQKRTQVQINHIKRGGYILLDSDKKPEIILIATGSEVAIAIEAAKISSKKVRVVSMPSSDVFDQQEDHYKQSVLPDYIHKRLAIEAAAGDFWYKYLGSNGKVIALDRFGLSAPAPKVFSELGFTVDHILQCIDAF